MGMQTDIKAANVSVTGTVFASRTRVRSLFITPSATAGTITIRDGGAGGVTVLDFATTAAGAPFSVYIPDQGVLFYTDVHATVSNATAIVFYG